jgi:hypothetical protein
MSWLKSACLALSLAVLPAVAWGQTPSALVDGTPLPAATLNSLFAGKLDVGLGLGTAIGQIPQFINYNGSGFAGLHLGSRLILDQATPAPGDFAVLQINRTTTFTGGTGLFSNILRTIGSIGANDATNNWGIVSTMSTSGHAGGETTAGFFQGRSLAGSTDFDIPLIADYRDETNLGTAASGISGGGPLELDVEANGADDAINLLTLGGTGVRKALHIVAVRLNGANLLQTEVSNAIWGSTQTGPSGPADAHTNFGSFIGFGLNTQMRTALDTRNVIPVAGSSNPVAAVTMAAGQTIDFNGGAALNSAPQRYWWYDSAAARMKYNVGAGTVFSVDGSGNVRAAGTVTPSVTP